MAESTDKKTRKIAEKRVEPGKEFESYQEAQNQLLAIQAEQQQNLALQANDAMNVQQQNQTLAQAAEVMAMDNLNPATQGILAGYGLNHPRVIKQSNTQRQGPNNITINNTTINNASGPVQGREISIRPQEAGQSKFKAWLTNVFARQDAQWQKQNQEYARRESSLTRNANKMMRKLEGLGKEIGNVIDPRKQAQRAQNSTMNLLKALGLVYFAKKLPDILGLFNNAEKKIRGWIGEIGDKIKGVFGDGDKNIFDGLIDKLWNVDETGILNEFLKTISKKLYERKKIADSAIDLSDMSIWKPGNAVKTLFSWISTFFGGERAALGLINREVEGEIQSGLRLTESAGNEILHETDGTVIDLSGTGLTRDMIDGKYASTSIEYSKWAKENNISEKEMESHSTKERFLKEAGGSFLTYFGEADILTKKLHELHTSKVYTRAKTTSDIDTKSTLTKKDFSMDGEHLSSTSRRATLAASLDIYKILKGTHTTIYSVGRTKITHKHMNINRVLYLLKLLSDRRSIYVFKKFTDLFNINSDNISSERIKLIKEQMTERDRWFYCSDDTHVYSTSYQKIVDINIPGEKRTLFEEDFNSHKGENEWEVVEIKPAGIQEIIYLLTGNKSIDYTTDTQTYAINTLQNLGIIDQERANNAKTAIRVNNNYDQRIAGLKDIISEKEEARYDASTNVHYDSSKEYKISGTTKYTSDGNDGIKTFSLTEEEVKANMDKVRDALKDEGFTDTQIAGIMGVIAHESAGTFDPRIVSTVNKKGGGIKRGAGEGIVQWTGSRRKKFKEWWEKEHPEEAWPGTTSTTLDDQIRFFLKEFRERPAYNMIKNLNREYSGDEAKILEKTVEYFTRGYENGSTRGLMDPSDWPKVYDGKTFKQSMKERLPKASGILNTYFNKSIKPIQSEGEIVVPGENSGNSFFNGTGPRALPVNNSSNSNYYGLLSDATYTVTPETTPTIETPTNTQTVSQSLALAENITPTEKVNQSSENNNEILLARCAEGIDYIAKSMAPLSEVINSGNMMLAETVSKSGGLTNLTPYEPQLEMNKV